VRRRAWAPLASLCSNRRLVDRHDEGGEAQKSCSEGCRRADSGLTYTNGARRVRAGDGKRWAPLAGFTVVPQLAFPADLDEPSWRSRGSQAEALWTYHDQRARKEEP
jgi:hypothetical protein